MPFSHHSHSGQFCQHASGSLEAVVKEAIRQGFTVYGLTEHVPRYRQCDLYPEEAEISIDELVQQFQRFLVEAHRLKAAYASQITLLVGLETEYISSADLDALDKLLKENAGRIEYIVGSVHHVNNVPIDFDLPTFQRAVDSLASHTHEVFLETYFDAQFAVMQQFRPEVIGHFDLCRLYQPDLRILDFPSVREKVERNIRFAVSYGALFEINAAAFRKGWTSAYPASDIVEIILDQKGRFTLSDDSHGPHAVGLNYHRLPDYLRSVGISELWYLKPVTTANAGGRWTEAVRFDGAWAGLPFWSAL